MFRLSVQKKFPMVSPCKDPALFQAEELAQLTWAPNRLSELLSLLSNSYEQPNSVVLLASVLGFKIRDFLVSLNMP